VRIHRRTHQLRVSGACGVDDKRDSQGYGAPLIRALRIGRCRTSNNSKICFWGAARPANISRGPWPRMVTALLWSSANGWAARAPMSPACPSKNLIYSARVAWLARGGGEFGVEMDALRVDMRRVQRRKREMVGRASPDARRAFHRRAGFSSRATRKPQRLGRRQGRGVEPPPRRTVAPPGCASFGEARLRAADGGALASQND